MVKSRVLTSVIPFAILLVGIAIAPISPAEAFSLSGVDVAANPGNTADVTAPGPNKKLWKSATESAVTSGSVAEVAGNTLLMSARYSSILVADRDGSGVGSTSPPSSTLSVDSTYHVLFTVEDPNNLGYDLTIDTSRIGALTIVSDGGGNATATLNAVTAALTIDGGATLTGGLLNLGGHSLTSSTGANSAFNDAGTLTLLNQVGTHEFRLDFSWTLNQATSNDDEVAIRLGFEAALSGSTAGDYPGVGSRDADGDGHFVDIQATLLTTPVSVPEPGIGGLFAFAGVAWLAGLAGRRLFPRRQR